MNESDFSMTHDKCGTDDCCANHEADKPGNYSSGHNDKSECDPDCGEME
jgi:hypothetical protein